MTVSPWLTFEKLKELQTQADSKPEILATDLNLYADKLNGDDANDGLTAATAVENLEQALALASRYFPIDNPSAFQLTEISINLAANNNVPGERYTTGDKFNAYSIPRLVVRGSGEATCFVDMGDSGLSIYGNDVTFRDFTVPSGGSTWTMFNGKCLYLDLTFTAPYRWNSFRADLIFSGCEFNATYGSLGPFIADTFSSLVIANNCVFTSFDITGSASFLQATDFSSIDCNEPVTLTGGRLGNASRNSYIEYRPGSSAGNADLVDSTSNIIVI